MAVDGVALAKLGYDGFAKLLGYFGQHRKAARLKRQIDVAWRELLKGDAADEATIEAALAAARKVNDTSSDHIKLAARYAGTKKTPKKKAAKKKAAKPKGKKAPKKKAKKRK